MFPELIEYGYLGLFIAAFLAATILPFSSDVVMYGMLLSTKFEPVECVIIASIGNWLGGLTSYYLGYLGKWMWIEKYMRVKKEKVLRFKNYMDKYGPWSALFSWIPVIGDPLAVALGFFKVNIKKVFVLMFIGKAVRYIAIAYLAIGTNMLIE